MKKLSLFALAAAGLLFGACSDKDEVAQVVNPINFEDGAYIGISLSLPSADNTTRANDELNNGTEDEFTVKNATLYIFKVTKGNATPDASATYVDKVSLGNTYEADDQPAGSGNHEVQNPAIGTKITSTYSQATLIPNDLASKMKADTENDYYAYVIINHNGQIDAPTADVTTFAQFSQQEFEAIGADIAAEKNIYETGLLMTNAPICDKSGGSAAPADGAKYTTLVKLDNQKIFGSRAEAVEAPAACVYVERAAVKITVIDNRGDNTTIGEGDAALNVVINGWQVINNEPTYYNTRQIEAAWGPYTNADKAAASNKYRFVSLYQFEPTLPTTTGHTTGFRTYFAKDVQYDANATLANTVASDERPWIAVDKHAYTTENTFDVQRQTWRNTTMVTIKATIGTAGFYTVGKGSQVMYATVDDAKAAIENIVKGDNDVAQALTDLRAKISANHVNTTVTSGLTVNFTAPTAGTTGVAFTIALDYDIDGTAYTTFSETAGEDGKSEASLKADLEAAIAAAIYVDPTATEKEYKDEVLLSFYKDGESYYNVRIQHFGDAETPWSAAGNYIYGGGNGVNEIYFGAANDATLTNAQIAAGEQNFLGRYGVVRDNWYKLSVDKIGKIGTAEPVDPSTTTPDTPDDEIENFISVHVHIVPWVLREQSVQF